MAVARQARGGLALAVSWVEGFFIQTQGRRFMPQGWKEGSIVLRKDLHNDFADCGFCTNTESEQIDGWKAYL